MQTRRIAVKGGQVGSNGLPLLPATSARNIHSAEEFSSEAIQADFNLSTTQATSHTSRECAWGLVAEVYILQLNIVTIMDVADIDTDLIILFCLHTFRKRHGLSLYLTVGIELSNGLHTLVGRHDGGEATVGIVLKLLHSHTTAKAATIGELAGVVEEIRVTLEVSHTTVVGKRLGV